MSTLMLRLERWHRGVSHLFPPNDSKSKLVSSQVRCCFCNCRNGRHCLQSKIQAVPFQSCFIPIIQTPHCHLLQHQLRRNCNEPPKAFLLIKKKHKKTTPLPQFLIKHNNVTIIVWFALHILRRDQIQFTCQLLICNFLTVQLFVSPFVSSNTV